MSGTPRLRSAFPSTPQQGSSPSQRTSSAKSPQHASPSSKLQDIGSLQPSKPDPESPLIPLTALDAPSQRFYVVILYIALLLYKLWDFFHLTIDETESLWLFLKWISIDGVFLFGLPTFRIPWLEWSSITITVVYLLHAVVDGLLMFRIGFTFSAALAGIVNLLFGSEISMLETRVRPAKIQSPSHILGRQIINILPEGSAALNPSSIPLCLNVTNGKDRISIPLQINQTIPKSIELVRYDLETSHQETVFVPRKEIEAAIRHRQPSQPLVVSHTVAKTGLYRVLSVVDETNSPVQIRPSEALVVACPSAKLVSFGTDRCRGDLSDVTMKVKGTPPLRVRYRKTINKDDNVVTYQSIQPEDFVSPLVRQRDSGALVGKDLVDMSWANLQEIVVPLNEALMTSGHWTYTIEEVIDACNNKVSYTGSNDVAPTVKQAPVTGTSFYVHDRPKINFDGYSVLRPLEVAAGRAAQLPFAYSSTGRGVIPDVVYNVTYSFVAADQSDRPLVEREMQFTNIKIKNIHEKHPIKEPGLYTIESVETQFCSGEVLEPAVCMLINPPKPKLVYTSEAISDKCAGRPIGLRVTMDLVGTPPFHVSYSIQKSGDSASIGRVREIAGSRDSIEFRPENAGHYTYKFTEISDKHYWEPTPLRSDKYTLEQDVKPSVSAHFINAQGKIQACIDQMVSFRVKLQGEGPWTLEYELIHAGKRTKERVADIQDDIFTIKTDKLGKGGDYSLALVSVKDAAGCKETLRDEVKFNIRQQKPKVSFGVIEGKRVVRTLAGKYVDLPLRFQGVPPWTLHYKDAVGKVQTRSVQKANEFLRASSPGSYSLVDVWDNSCPGLVDESSQTFVVETIARPSIKLAESPLLEQRGEEHVRKSVCEGEEDALDVLFEGSPPFDVKYEEYLQAEHGTKSLKATEMNIPLHSAQIKMDTAKAGGYKYVFTKLGDYNYDHDSKQHQPLIILQNVSSKPTASFEHPGKVYSFCQGREGGPGDGVIPMKFTGKAPFTVDLELKHSNKNSGPPTTLTKSNIPNSSYNLRIPQAYLQPGNSALVIRRVRDARGCERQLDLPTSPASSSSQPAANLPRVQISVHDPPIISPADLHKTHYCVGERLSFALSGLAPFTVYYRFEDKDLKAVVNSPVFRRIADTPGNFSITAISDAASECPGSVALDTKFIHSLPSVRVSHGRETRVDIHAGGEAEILFEFGGEPPFEFTYTRSENAKGKQGAGKHGRVLETKTLRSETVNMTIRAGEEGTYEVVAVRDRWCSFARPGVEGLKGVGGGGLGLEMAQGQKFLMED